MPRLNLELPPVTPADPEDGDPDQNPPDINDAPLNGELDGSQSSSAITKHAISTTVVKGEPTDLTPLLPSDFPSEGITWDSACDGIATVTDGTVLGVKCGRTEISAAADGTVATILVTVEFLTSTNNGYVFPTSPDEATYRVASEYEADRLIDKAIATHKSKITVDFSSLGALYDASEDYNSTLELSSHVAITKTWYPSNPNVITFEIEYEADTASQFTEPTPENTHTTLANANMIIRDLKKDDSRPDDFEGFPINLENSGTMDVYNSEELWWALENNLKPTFPLHNSKAELFYERAKMLLRDIISDGMSDYEKVIAIHDALVDLVAYDYDAADAPATEDFHTDVCYYLEGVFERGVAVCDGKSKAFVLLCGIEGIGAVRDFGDARDGGVGHAWNYVELFGEWYLVDTTAADAAYGAETAFGSEVGKPIEITVYDTTLVSLNALLYDYEYSGIWSALVAGENADVPYLYLSDYVSDGEEINFFIDSESELISLIEILTSEDLCDECVLTFAINPTALDESPNLPFEAADEALPEGAEYSIYTMEISGLKNYFMFIKGI